MSLRLSLISKKLIPAFLGLILLWCSGLFNPASAATTATLVIAPTSQNLTGANKTGNFNIYLDPKGSNVSSAELVINFNPNVITVNNIAPGAFFTSSAGSPVEIIKSIDTTNGKIHYALGFPLGSGRSSTTANIAAVVSFTTKATGTSTISFVTSGTPKTQIADINAQNVLASASSGSVVVSSSATPTPSIRPSSSPTPRPNTPTATKTPTPTVRPSNTPTPRPSQTITPTPPSGTKANLSFTPVSQTKTALNTTGKINAFITPNGNSVSSIELVINFNPAVLRIDNVIPGAFFTNPGVGNPVEIKKDVNNTTGRIHYALGFPLGSQFFSTQANIAAEISFTVLARGTSQFTYVISGVPSTNISDVNARNVLGTIQPGSVTVVAPTPTVTAKVSGSPTIKPGFGAILKFEPPTQSLGVNRTGTVNANINPNSETVSSVELVISFNPNIIRVDNITPGNFFTNAGVGAPVEIIKSIDKNQGKIHYALGFPLGSSFFSTQQGNAATISFTTLSSGTSNLTYITSGNPKTNVADINARSVLGSTKTGSVTVTSGTQPTSSPAPTGAISVTPLPTGTGEPFEYPGCVESSHHWKYIPFPKRSGIFTVEYDAIPLSRHTNGKVNAYIGVSGLLSRSSGSNYGRNTAIVNFSPNGYLAVRNSKKFDYDKLVSYRSGSTYHLRLVINTNTHRYQVFVTPPGGKEVQIASNYAFRYENRNRNSLDGLAIFSRGGKRSIKVCDITVTPSTKTRRPRVTPTVEPTQEPIACATNDGDANENNVVNLDDFNIWLANYNTPTKEGPTVGDFDCSDMVDGVDFVIWLNNYRSRPNNGNND